MTLGEFLDTFHIPMDDHVAVFRYDAWDGAPEFSCEVRHLKYSDECKDLMDREVRGICSGGDLARCCLDDYGEEQGIFEIALDWDGSDHAYD